MCFQKYLHASSFKEIIMRNGWNWNVLSGLACQHFIKHFLATMRKPKENDLYFIVWPALPLTHTTLSMDIGDLDCWHDSSLQISFKNNMWLMRATFFSGFCKCKSKRVVRETNIHSPKLNKTFVFGDKCLKSTKWKTVSRSKFFCHRITLCITELLQGVWTWPIEN